MSGYLKIANGTNTKDYTLTTGDIQKPYLKVSNSILPLTTRTTSGMHLKVQDIAEEGSTHYLTSTAGTTQYTTKVNSVDMSSVTTLYSTLTSYTQLYAYSATSTISGQIQYDYQYTTRTIDGITSIEKNQSKWTLYGTNVRATSKDKYNNTTTNDYGTRLITNVGTSSSTYSYSWTSGRTYTRSIKYHTYAGYTGTKSAIIGYSGVIGSVSTTTVYGSRTYRPLECTTSTTSTTYITTKTNSAGLSSTSSYTVSRSSFKQYETAIHINKSTNATETMSITRLTSISNITSNYNSLYLYGDPLRWYESYTFKMTTYGKGSSSFTNNSSKTGAYSGVKTASSSGTATGTLPGYSYSFSTTSGFATINGARSTFYSGKSSTSTSCNTWI